MEGQESYYPIIIVLNLGYINFRGKIAPVCKKQKKSSHFFFNLSWQKVDEMLEAQI